MPRNTAHKLSAICATAMFASITLGLAGCGGESTPEDDAKMKPRPVPEEKASAPGPGGGAGLEAQGEGGG